MVRARVIAAANLREIVEALGWLSPADAARLALGHPTRPLIVEGLEDAAPLCAALEGSGIPYARSGAAVAWAADPARTAELHGRLREAAPGAFEAVSLALARWSEPPGDVPLPDGRVLRLSERVHVMGVVNVTPDSFSDGGLFLDPAAAVDHGLALVEQGADVLDVGGESTRPGAEPVPEEEEQRRAIPVVEILAGKAGVPVSIDTRKSSVARLALDAGAQIVNDVSAGRADTAMLPLAAERRAAVILMHMRGDDPRTMQQDPSYRDVVGEVAAFLAERAGAARAAGVTPERILVDPGFGFGKTREHNLVLLRRLRELRCLGHPVVAGTSRKSFIGSTLDLPPSERLEGTAATVALAVVAGAAVVRVHEVRPMVRVVQMVEAVLGAREPGGPPDAGSPRGV